MTRAPAFTAPLGVPSTSTVTALSQTAALAPPLRTRRAAVAPYRRANVCMVSQTNLAKKQEKVQSVKEKLESCQMIFASSLDGLSVKDLFELRRELPETSSCATVKNTLMRRAIAESKWECVGDLAKQSNLWFFVGEDVQGTIKAYQKFSKELKREDLKGGAFEGEFCDAEGVTAIGALPSKIELITRFAVAVKMVPTKVARAVNAVPTKVARAIKLAVADEDAEKSDASEK